MLFVSKSRLLSNFFSCRTTLFPSHISVDHKTSVQSFWVEVSRDICCPQILSNFSIASAFFELTVSIYFYFFCCFSAFGFVSNLSNWAYLKYFISQTRDQDLHKPAAFKMADMWAGLDSNSNRGGGYLNPTISQPQYMVHSLNPVQIQTGAGVFELTISQPPASVHGTQFESWIQI